MKIRDIIGIPVIAMKEGSRQGRVVDAVIDQENNLVSHFLVCKDSKYDLLIVEAADVSGIGDDYMVVMDSGDIRRVFGDPKRMETVSRGFYLGDAEALSSAGRSLGKVADFDMDESTGQIRTLILEDGQEFSANDILAMSGTTVFVQAPGERKTRPQDTAPEAIVPEQPASHGKRSRGRKNPAPPVPVHAQRAYQSSTGPADTLRDLSGLSEPSSGSSTVKVNFRKMLIGKKMAQDVVSDDGVFKANEGDTITEWMVQLAEQHNALPLLMKYVEPA